jgi:signal transduction histidine kinase
VGLARALLHPVLVELLKNALAALPSGRPGRIEVAASPEGGGCLIRVGDNGRGLSDEQARLLEEPFAARRLQGTIPAGQAVQQGGGLGLGFFLVRQAVARWGGRVAVRSVLDQGTTVTLHLPRNEPEQPGPRNQP